jgi:hypothetical protein
MTGGQILVFWCAVAGFVVLFCAEVVRAWRNRPPLGHTPNHRLMDELRRHREDRP